MQRYWTNVTYNEDQTVSFCAHVIGRDTLESIIREAIATLEQSHRRAYIIRSVRAVAVNLNRVGQNAWNYSPVDGQVVQTPEGFVRVIKWPKR